MMLKKLAAFLLGFSLVGCGATDEDLEALVSLIDSVDLSDCFESEEEGYVSDDPDSTDEQDEAAMLAECKTYLTEAFDTNGDGEVSGDSEIQALNADIEKRQELNEAEWAAAGLTPEQGKEQEKARRKVLRQAATASCITDFDANSDGTLSKEEKVNCHNARKTEREEIRQDLRCSKDETGECAPLSADKLAEVRTDKRKKAKDFATEVAPNGTLDESAVSSAGDSLRTAREQRKTERAGRVEENKTKDAAGKAKRKAAAGA